MITTQFLIRLDLKTDISFNKATKLMDKCHTALYQKKPLSVDTMAGNSCCAPYIEVVVENADQATKIESKLKKIFGQWLSA